MATVLWTLAVAWVVVGAVTAVVMIRRGHDPALWAVLAVVLGPAAAGFAVGAARAEDRGSATVLAAGRAGPGDVDLLVGIDGSPESLAALESAVALHGAHLGRLTLVAVVPHETEPDEGTVAVLAAAARSVADHGPTTAVLHGDPVVALSSRALAGGHEIIVVGARGRGRSVSPLGSVATRLASGAPVPVLVGPARRAQA